MSEERRARIALGRLGEPGDPRLARLVRDLGAAEVYRRLRDERDPEGLHSEVAARLAVLDPDEELAGAQRLGLRFVCPGDPEWPDTLDDLDRAESLQGRGGAPLGLWVKGPGRLDELAAASVAIVGSRSATVYGTSVAGEMAAGVAGEGRAVVSGAAFGIDQAAHRGALAARGPTVAVLACGADRCYPSAHEQLLAYIADTGVVVSEVPPGCAPTRLRFLARNRMIAALAQGVVVVEAAVRSGALNTAGWAQRLNRVVMGVPGPVTSAPSQGVHELIRARGAALVTRADDVLELLAPVGSRASTAPQGQVHVRDRLSGVEQQVLDALPVHRASSPQTLARVAGLSEQQVRRSVARLVRTGLAVAESTSGGVRWRLTASTERGPTPE